MPHERHKGGLTTKQAYSCLLLIKQTGLAEAGRYTDNPQASDV